MTRLWRRIVALFAVVASGCVAFAASEAATEASRTPVEQRRSADQTFLTFPEWYLVFNPAEYAGFIARETPSEFPYFTSIGQFWGSYRAVSGAIPAGTETNWGYHVMIWVIGISSTVEYGLKSAYESTVGRLTAALTGHGPTAEERYAAKTAQDYVDFIRVNPWYDFDFVARLKGVWSETGYVGPDLIRKCERKLALSLEYAFKAGYGWIIRAATHASYDPAAPDTVVLLDHAPSASAGLPELRTLQTFADGAALVSVPRYQAFTHYANELARAGLRFDEVAGNRSGILVSLLVSGDAPTLPATATVLFKQSLPTSATTRRVALVVPVAELSALLNTVDGKQISVEHIFDY